jgi:hypothetical protein
MSNSSKRDTRTAEHKETVRKALELRKAGATYDQIASSLGLADRSGAYRMVQGAIKEITREPAEDVRTLELERLDALMMAHWAKAKADPRVAVVVLQILDRRSRYLGLDAPKKIEQDVTVNSDAEDVISKLDRIAAEYAAKSNPGSADSE